MIESNLNTVEQKLSFIDEISAYLQTLDAATVRIEFEIADNAELLKTTISLCDRCVTLVPAAIYSQNERVWKNACCPVHGIRTALLENNVAFYRLSNKDNCGVHYASDRVFDIPEYSDCCGSGSSNAGMSTSDHGLFSNQIGNKSCTVLIEITNACNLACRVCYANASGDRVMEFGELKSFINRLIEDKGFVDSVQVTGGEATLHPEYWDIVDWLYHRQEIGKIYLPTNGLEFSKAVVAARLEQYRDKLLVLLQFDGREKDTNLSLRRTDTVRLRERAIRQLAKIGVCMQLTMTVVDDVSEQEIGWVIRQGLKYRHIRLVGFLPAFFTGRYQLAHNARQRSTLSDVVRQITSALPDKVSTDDFLPIPCSHPNCGWTTLFARRFGLLFNITQKINLEEVMNEVAYKTILDKREIRSVIGQGQNTWLGKILTVVGKRMIRPKDVFGVAIKPFMDHYSYDHDRVANCCHHILDTRGQLISFCEYNARFRSQDSWDRKPELRGKHEAKVKAIMDSMDG